MIIFVFIILQSDEKMQEIRSQNMSSLSENAKEIIRDFFIETMSSMSNWKIEKIMSLVESVAELIDFDYEDFYTLTGFKYGQFDELNYTDDTHDHLFFSEYL